VTTTRSRESEEPESQQAIWEDTDLWIRQFIKHFELDVVDATRDLPPDASVSDSQVATARAILAAYLESGMELESVVELLARVAVERRSVEAAWSDALNQRRLALIDRAIEGSLTPAESIELAGLTRIMRDHAKMPAVDKPRKKRIFIASSQADVAEVQKAIQQFDLDAVTLDQIATPGTTWVDSLHRCLNDADMVIGIMGDRRKDTNVFFELGVASALNKPTLLFITPDYPIDHIPPSGIPYLRMDLRNEDAVMFGLKQALSLSPRDRIRQPTEGSTTQPIGPVADQLLAKLAQTSPRGFEDLIYDAIRATGVPTIARGSEAEDRGIDFAVWSSDLEPMITNPLLIECKYSLRSQSDVNEAIGRMFRALEAIPHGWGIVLYKEAGKVSKATPRSLPVVFVSAEDFINGLRDTGLAEYVRKLRNGAFHGL